MKLHYYIEDIIEICDDTHLTAEEVFLKVKEKYKDAGKSSIYRNLEDLSKKGILKKVEGLGKKTYFEKDKGNHVHLVDTNTGEIIDFCPLKFDTSFLPPNFSLESMDLKFFGKIKS
nr:transcriptional repressor [Candidatus Gracilibacteria bacterium]